MYYYFSMQVLRHLLQSCLTFIFTNMISGYETLRRFYIKQPAIPAIKVFSILFGENVNKSMQPSSIVFVCMCIEICEKIRTILFFKDEALRQK